MSEFREESQRERYGTLTHRESGKQQSMIAENASGEKWRSGHCCSTFRLSSSALLDGMAFYFSCHYFFAVHRYSKEYLFPKFVWNVFRVSFLTIRNDATEVSEQIQMPPITRWQTCRTHTKWNRIYEKFGREDQGWIWKLKAQSNFWIHLRGCIFYELIIGQLLKCIDHRCTNFIIVVYIV